MNGAWGKIAKFMKTLPFISIREFNFNVLTYLSSKITSNVEN